MRLMPLRCSWCGDDPLYVHYHDTEWGFAVRNDQKLFEKICLEGFQAGLSWITILRKRENFRQAFYNFDIEKVAAFSQDDVARILGDVGVVRHRGKIEATINNAQRCKELFATNESLAAFIWSFAPSDAEQKAERAAGIPAQTQASQRLSKELRKRGWKFVGPTTMYAFMQSMGIVNDHVAGCHVYDECETLRRQALL